MLRSLSTSAQYPTSARYCCSPSRRSHIVECPLAVPRPVGGAAHAPNRAFSFRDLSVYNQVPENVLPRVFDNTALFEFLVLLPKPQALVLVASDGGYLAVDAPLDVPLACMQVPVLKSLALRHHLVLGRDLRTREAIAGFILAKFNEVDVELVSVFRKLPEPLVKPTAPQRSQCNKMPKLAYAHPNQRTRGASSRSVREMLEDVITRREQPLDSNAFPPQPLSQASQENIMLEKDSGKYILCGRSSASFYNLT